MIYSSRPILSCREYRRVVYVHYHYYHYALSLLRSLCWFCKLITELVSRMSMAETHESPLQRLAGFRDSVRHRPLSCRWSSFSLVRLRDWWLSSYEVSRAAMSIQLRPNFRGLTLIVFARMSPLRLSCRPDMVHPGEFSLSANQLYGVDGDRHNHL